MVVPSVVEDVTIDLSLQGYSTIKAQALITFTFTSDRTTAKMTTLLVSSESATNKVAT